ncbi:hypothetical protein Snoj_17440 [Streptomyces nojiriensis]|uniref:Uncharacterized protein n=1 Tax=Streptomyces nojiriensis TaxID=66374 RepID=A0ABQ3SI59_9ACTN|nr:hypothetical protein GCM10010205_77010 [Streptomyces nojiriensis]GHI67826.1 hypothetical protein Snoj_17440 [Streptomyces nojiriensis]
MSGRADPCLGRSTVPPAQKDLFVAWVLVRLPGRRAMRTACASQEGSPRPAHPFPEQTIDSVRADPAAIKEKTFR